MNLSPDGTTVAFIASGTTMSANKTIMIWDLNSNSEKKLTTDTLTVDIKNLTCSPDGKQLAYKIGRYIEVFNLTSREHIRTINDDDGFNTFAFSTDGKMIATTSSIKNRIKLWNLISGKLLETLDNGKDMLRLVAFLPSGKMIASLSYNATIKLWDLTNGVIKTLTGHNKAITCIAFSSDGILLASGSDDMTINLWNLTNGVGVISKIFTGHDKYIISVAFSSDGKLLVSSQLTKIKLWDLKSSSELKTITIDSKDTIRSVYFSQDGKQLVCNLYNKLTFWDLTDLNNIHLLKSLILSDNSLREQSPIRKPSASVSLNNDNIGSGAYGIAFSPALECTNNQYIPKDSVGKVFFSKKSADEEFKIAKMLKDIDPKQKFLFYPVSECTVDKKKNLAVLEHLEHPKLLTDVELIQHILPHGGTTLSKYMKTHYELNTVPRATFIKIIEPLFYAVKLLINNNYVHNDIKAGNVVVSNKKRVKLIDFGMLCKFEDEFSSINGFLNLYDHPYDPYPPEFCVTQILTNTFDISTWYNNVNKNNNLYSSFFNANKDNFRSFYKPAQEYFKTFFEEVNKKSIAKKRDYISSVSVKKIDIYSIGIVILSLSGYLLPYQKDDQTAFPLFNELLFGLINPSPVARMDIDSAIAKVRILRKLYKPDPFIEKKDSPTLIKKFEPKTVSIPETFFDHLIGGEKKSKPKTASVPKTLSDHLIGGEKKSKSKPKPKTAPKTLSSGKKKSKSTLKKL